MSRSSDGLDDFIGIAAGVAMVVVFVGIGMLCMAVYEAYTNRDKPPSGGPWSEPSPAGLTGSGGLYLGEAVAWQ